MPPRRILALVDCNSFYASCEKVFAPALANKPVVVLSNNDGCIIARSAEASPGDLQCHLEALFTCLIMDTRPERPADEADEADEA